MDTQIVIEPVPAFTFNGRQLHLIHTIILLIMYYAQYEEPSTEWLPR